MFVHLQLVHCHLRIIWKSDPDELQISSPSQNNADNWLECPNTKEWSLSDMYCMVPYPAMEASTANSPDRCFSYHMHCSRSFLSSWNNDFALNTARDFFFQCLPLHLGYRYFAGESSRIYLYNVTHWQGYCQFDAFGNPVLNIRSQWRPLVFSIFMVYIVLQNCHCWTP